MYTVESSINDANCTNTYYTENTGDFNVNALHLTVELEIESEILLCYIKCNILCGRKPKTNHRPVGG